MGNNASTPRHISGSPERTGRPVRQATPLPESFLTAIDGLHSLFQFPGTPEYTVNNTAWNFDSVGSPAAIFVPKTEADISAFLKIWSAAPLGAPFSLSIAGGRHSHYGLANDAIVIDMANFTTSSIDAEKKVGTFGAGMRLQQFDSECKKHGLAVPAGTNPDTGIAGLTIGGGFGWLSRRHGMTCDNLIGMRMVLASGEIVNVSAEEHEDLLWASRGGGGNFGVAISFTFTMHPRGDVYMGATVFLTRMMNDIPSLLLQWRNYCESASNDVACMAVLNCNGPFVLPAAYVGDLAKDGGVAEAERLLAPLRAIGAPMINSYSVQPYCDGVKIGKDLQSSAVEHQPAASWYDSGTLLADLNPESIAILVEATSSAHSPNKLSGIILMQLGGVPATVPRESTAVGFRNAKYLAMLLGRWPDCASNEEYIRERTKCRDWVKKLVKDLAPYTVGFYQTLGDVALDDEKAAAAAIGAASLDAAAKRAEAVASSTSSLSESALATSAAVSAFNGLKSPDTKTASGVAPAPLPVGVDHRTKINSHWSIAQFERLVAIKTKYDQHNIFTNNNNILPHQSDN